MVRFLAGLSLWVIGATVLAGSSSTERYFQGLRERGLLDLAEGELLRRLAEPELPAAQETTLTAELARTFGRHALFTQGDEQADLWRRAATLLDEYLDQHANFPERDGFRVLQGELLLEHGRAERWRAELQLDQAQARSDARRILARAVEHLTALEPELAKHLLAARRDAVTALKLPAAAELYELLRRTRLRLGEAELEQARLAEGDQRKPMLQAAESSLDKAIETGGTPQELWPARVALAEAARLAGDGETARTRLAELDAAALDGPAKDAIAKVMAELLIDDGKPDRAVTFLIDYRRERGSLTGGLRLLQIRGLAEAARRLDERDENAAAEALRDEVETIVKWTTAEHGGYWAYRARLAARNIEHRAAYGTELLEELRQAQLEADLGHLEVAAGHFEKAAELAKNVEQRASYTLSRGRLLLQAEHFEEAARVLAATWENAPDSDEAAIAHFLSAIALGRWHDATPSAARREAYVARLKEHRELFPAAPTASRAALRLATVHEQRRQYSLALSPLREIVDDPTYGVMAAAAIARNHDHILEYLANAQREADTPKLAATRARQRDEWAVTARRELMALTRPLRSAGESASLSRFQAELALRGAGMLMDDPAQQAAAGMLVDRLLAAVAQPHLPEDAAFWEAIEISVGPLAVVSLARRGDYEPAEARLRDLVDAPIGDLLKTYRGLLANDQQLESLGSERPIVFGPRPPDLRAMVLGMIEDRGELLEASEIRQLELALARAEFDTGETGRAAERFRRLVDANPDDRELLQHAAEALLESDDPAFVRQARDLWQQLERQSPSGSDAWWRARLGTIEASLALEDVDDARKRLTVTKLLHPDLGGAAWRSRFAAVEERLKREGSRVSAE